MPHVDGLDSDETSELLERIGDVFLPREPLEDGRHCIECGALLETEDLFCFSCGGSE